MHVGSVPQPGVEPTSPHWKHEALTVGQHLMPVRMAVIQKTTNNKCCPG